MNRWSLRALPSLCLGTLLIGPAPLVAQDDPPAPAAIQKREPTRFLRVESDEFENPVALQTATARYVLKDDAGNVKLEVVLEGVIHVADATYYRALNQRFKHYDTVLYELIAPADRRVPDPQNETGPNPLRMVQQMAAEGLGLSHQVDEIDYTAPNMVHSDLSPEEMAEALRNRGEDQFTMFADAMLHMMRKMKRERAEGEAGGEGGQAGQGGETAEPPKPFDFSILTDPEGAVKMRRLLASGFTGVDALDLPASQMALLVDVRNRRAMEVFQKELDAGKRRVAFFWGAAHMPDFEKRLILDYGLEPAGVTWRNAWDLREGAVRRTPLETLLDKTLRGALEDTLRELQKKSGGGDQGATPR